MRNSTWGIPVIDFHCHFPVADDMMAWSDEDYIRKHGREKFAKLRADWRRYQEEWWAAYSFAPPEEDEPSPQVQAERWSDEVERAQLERVVFVTGGGNETLASVVAANPSRFSGFAHHDPFGPDAAGELRRAVVELGLSGFKVLAPALRGAIDDEALHPVWQVADELGIPVLVHFGQLDGGGGIAQHQNIDPLKLHDVAKAFPDLQFVVPHFGCGYPKELLHLAWACRNVNVDSSGNNEWVRWMPYPLDVKQLFRTFLETIGPERILFGSDSAHFPRGLVTAYYDEQFRAVSQLGLSQGDISLLFSGNAARLLRIPIP